MLKHISLKVKLLISFLIVACVVLTVGWVGYTSINKMTEKTTTIVETVPLIDAAMEMKFALARGMQVVMEMVTSTSKVELNNALSDHKAMRDQFDKFAEAIINGAKTSEGVIVATTDERLREIVKQADDLHNKEFNSRALRIHELMLEVLNIQDQQKQLVAGSDVFVKNRQKIEGLAKVIHNLDFEADQSAETVLEILGEIEIRSRANIAAAVKASDDVAEVSQSTAVTGIVVGFTLALVIGFFLNYTISRPITRITNAAKAIANGDLNQKLDITSSDEIGVLANAMNEMINTIKQQIGYLENIPTPVMVIDKKYNVQYINKAASKFVNKSKEQCTNAKCYDLFKTKHCQTSECRLAQAMAQNDVVSGETVSCANNGETPIFYTGAPVKDKHGEIIGGLEFVADMTDNKKLMDSIQEQRRYQAQSVSQILNEMNKFAAGDLTVHLPVKKDDDIGNLFDGFNKAVGNISKMIRQVLEIAQSVSAATYQIRGSADELATATQEQSSQSSDVAAAVEEMARTIVENARVATQTANTANESGKYAKDGGEVVQHTVGKIKEIASVVKDSASTVQRLGESSTRIGEIVSVIDDIADQTNLLALNAAIEAARAGDQGRGFAVVADEVRRLAERTSEATQKIANMIREVQGETHQAVDAMKRGEKEVNEGMELADRAGEALNTIVTKSDEVVALINQMAAATEEQSTTSEEISRNVDAISAVSAESAVGVTQIARTTENLNQLTGKLNEMIQRFKLGNDNGFRETEFHKQVHDDEFVG